MLILNNHIFMTKKNTYRFVKGIYCVYIKYLRNTKFITRYM